MATEKTEGQLMVELQQKELLEHFKEVIMEIKDLPQSTATDMNMLRNVYNRLKGKIDPDF